MPELPEGYNYDGVIIHDNFKALERFARSKGAQAAACHGLNTFNGRFIVFQIDGVSFISTGMGSAQTNSLVESLSERKCRIIVKIGTCSALDDRLCEGDVIVPCGALMDEGATPWRLVKKRHGSEDFNVPNSERGYLQNKQFVIPDTDLREKLKAQCTENKIPYQSDIANPCVWSVDAYDCFDGSPQLYSQVNGQQYVLRELFSENQDSMSIVGVEMECSALFASAHDLGIFAAALIVVSRTRHRLIANSNSRLQEQEQYNDITADDLPVRDRNLIQQRELNCIQIALEVVTEEIHNGENYCNNTG